MEEFVILVNEKDEEIGVKEKLAAHRDGNLHRAFSVFILNSKGEILLQKRAIDKYHSGGLWSNTCCGHPRPGEKIKEAATRRLKEESGLSSKLEFVAVFQYKISLQNELCENEIDHIFIGRSDQNPLLIPSEVSAWRYVRAENLSAELTRSSAEFTHWFPVAFRQLLDSSMYKSS